MHYLRWKRQGDDFDRSLGAVPKGGHWGPPRGVCSIDGCDEPHFARGWCNRHWRRWQRRGGDPAIHRYDLPLIDMFNARWVPDGDCWRWTGDVSVRGYGRIKRRAAHRVSYELFVGPIPAGMTIDHLCFNTRCVNPAHLEPVTAEENLRREWEHRKTV
jgi:HNH endonuclease